VIETATAGDGVFFEDAEAGGCFPRIEEAGPGFPEGTDIDPGKGGNATEVLEEVENDPLCLKKDMGRTGHCSEDGTGGTVIAIPAGRYKGGTFSVGVEDHRDQLEAAGNEGFPGAESGGGFSGRIPQEAAAEVASGNGRRGEAVAVEIFRLSEGDKGAKRFGVNCFP